MKNLEKIFMLLAFIGAISSLIIALYDGTSWAWQFTTIMWIGVAFIKTKTNEK